MSGRTTWWAKDAAWHRRELQVELGEEFGAAGPHILDVLTCWAQEQKATRGEVRGGFRALSREAFVDRDMSRKVMEFAATIGALDDLQIDADGRRFVCRVSGFAADQERGRAAWRQAARRERDGLEPNPPSLSRSVTDSHGESRDVTRKPPPDQTRPERRTPLTPRGGELAIPALPTGGRARDTAAFHAQLERIGQVLLPGAPTRKARKAVEQAIRAGCTDRASVEAFLDEWWSPLRQEVSA